MVQLLAPAPVISTLTESATVFDMMTALTEVSADLSDPIVFEL